MVVREEFLKHLRDALNHLQDPNRLRRNPLAALFGVASRVDTPSALQRILVEAIEALEPKADEPSHCRAWRMTPCSTSTCSSSASRRSPIN